VIATQSQSAGHKKITNAASAAMMITIPTTQRMTVRIGGTDQATLRLHEQCFQMPRGASTATTGRGEEQRRSYDPFSRTGPEI